MVLTHYTYCKSHLAIKFILLLYAFFLLLTIGTDGWFRIETLRGDSAWFMMAGKSWMEGLRPYADFSDSKGPLLWFIYGLGYLISPHNYHGVFIFEVIAYWLNFIVLYKIAKIFLQDNGKSLVAVFLMSFIYFYPGMHQEIRVEDFCHIFQTYLLFVLIKTLYIGSYKKSYFFWIGFSLGCTLLMKYSYFITLLVPVVILLGYMKIKKIYTIPFLSCLSYLCIGFLTIFLPFYVYFTVNGIFSNFINEYFFSTGKTILADWKDHNIWEIIKDQWLVTILKSYIGTQYFNEYMRFILLGLVMTLYIVKRSTPLMILLVIWYGFSIMLFAINGGMRYYMTLGVFAFGGIILILKQVNRITVPFSLVCSGIILLILTVFTTHYIYSELFYSQRDLKVLEEKSKVENIINSKEIKIGRKPTLVYYKTWDKGEHINTNAIAGIKYWAYQADMTKEMDRQHEDDIFTKRPDFVIVCHNNPKAMKKLSENGYSQVLVYYPWPYTDEEWTYSLYENDKAM